MEQGVRERRRAPRTEIAIECTLHRRRGAPVCCRTVEMGTGGMSVCSERPLATDEVLAFDLPESAGIVLTGHARVLRQQAHQVYVLRFEQLPETARAGIERLVNRAR